jgi:rod shape determining protein RodA
MIVMAIPDYRQFSGLAVPIYIGTLLVLAFVLVVGNITSGAQSWIAFGTRTFQPSEFSKLLIIMVMAAYYSRYTDQQRETWKIQLGGMLLMGGPLLLVFIQPDLGTAIIFGAIWLAMAWAAGLRWHQLSLILVLALPMMVVGWLFVLNEEQRARLSTFYWLFTDPSKVDPNEGYNIIQSLNAISSGGLFGTGLTRGLLSQGNYIPVQYSDFIFAVISEEMGFVGGVVLIVLLALFLWLTLSIAERARDAFGKFLVVGIFGMLLTHVLVNIGVAMSILPVTGIPLPFVSYGGSFTVMIMMSVGLLENVAMRWRKIVF